MSIVNRTIRALMSGVIFVSMSSNVVAATTDERLAVLERKLAAVEHRFGTTCGVRSDAATAPESSSAPPLRSAK